MSFSSASDAKIDVSVLYLLQDSFRNFHLMFTNIETVLIFFFSKMLEKLVEETHLPPVICVPLGYLS